MVHFQSLFVSIFNQWTFFGEAYTLQRLVDQTLHNGLEALHLPKTPAHSQQSEMHFPQKACLRPAQWLLSLVQREQELVTPECVVAVSRFDVGESTAYLFPGAVTNCHELDTGAKGKQCVLDLEENTWDSVGNRFHFNFKLSPFLKEKVGHWMCFWIVLDMFWALSPLR